MTSVDSEEFVKARLDADGTPRTEKAARNASKFNARLWRRKVAHVEAEDAMIKRTLAAAYRHLATRVADEQAATLMEMAAKVEALGYTEECCPVCLEVTCDGSCPLAPVRNRNWNTL
jgi:hypothetical protein